MKIKFLKFFWRINVNLQTVDLWKLNKLQLYTDGFTQWSSGNLGFNLINFVNRKIFFANIIKQES